MAAEYQANPSVEYAEPDYIAKSKCFPMTPITPPKAPGAKPYDDLWGLKKIQPDKPGISRKAKDDGRVVDTGIDYTHAGYRRKYLDKSRWIPK